VNGTVYPNYVDVPLRIHSLTDDHVIRGVVYKLPGVSSMLLLSLLSESTQCAVCYRVLLNLFSGCCMLDGKVAW